MTQSATANRRILLYARPPGAPTAADFRTETSAVPKPQAGQVLLRTLYLSLDPYMRTSLSAIWWRATAAGRIARCQTARG
jgi:NADPH-dependent curcumin reductase